MLSLLIPLAHAHVQTTIYTDNTGKCVRVGVGTKLALVYPSETANDFVYQIDPRSATYDSKTGTEELVLGDFVMRVPVGGYDGARGCEGVLPLGTDSFLWTKWRFHARFEDRLILTNDPSDLPGPYGKLLEDATHPFQWTVNGTPVNVTVDPEIDNVLVPTNVLGENGIVQIMSPYQFTFMPLSDTNVFDVVIGDDEVTIGSLGSAYFFVLVDHENNTRAPAPRPGTSDMRVNVLYNWLVASALTVVLIAWFLVKITVADPSRPFAEFRYFFGPRLYFFSQAIACVLYLHVMTNMVVFDWPAWLCVYSGVCLHPVLVTMLVLLPVLVVNVFVVIYMAMFPKGVVPLYNAIEHFAMLACAVSFTPVNNNAFEIIFWAVFCTLWVANCFLETTKAFINGVLASSYAILIVHLLHSLAFLTFVVIPRAVPESYAAHASLVLFGTGYTIALIFAPVVLYLASANSKRKTE